MKHFHFTLARAQRLGSILLSWIVLLTSSIAISAADQTQPIPVAPQVLDAQQQRMAIMERAATATVAIFGLDGGGGGSGVIVSPDGYALTNYHVSSACGDHMRCGLNDGRIYDAVIVGVDASLVPDDVLRWEPSRGGDLFPHVYAPLALAWVTRAESLALGPDGHRFPTWVPG